MIFEWSRPILGWWSAKYVEFKVEEVWAWIGCGWIRNGMQIWIGFKLEVGFFPWAMDEFNKIWIGKYGVFWKHILVVFTSLLKVVSKANEANMKNN